MNNAEVEDLEALQVTLQQNPDSLTFARVADALMQRGRLEEALQICEEGVKRHPQYVTGHMVLGKCYMQKKLYEQAEKEFKRVLLFDPKYIAAHRCYGDLMREIGWENTCEMSYRKILHIDPLDDKVRGLVEEFARKAETTKPGIATPTTGSSPTATAATAPKAASPSREPSKTSPAPNSASSFKRIALDVDNLFEDAELKSPPAVPPSTRPAVPKSAPAPEKNEPSSGPRVEKSIPRMEKPAPRPAFETPAMAESKPTALSKSDEARFSSILDDIFQDEVTEEAQLYQRGEETKQGPPVDDENGERNALKKSARQTKTKTEETDDKKTVAPPDTPAREVASVKPEPAVAARRAVDFDAAFEEVGDEPPWQAPAPSAAPTESFAPAPEPAHAVTGGMVQEFEEAVKPAVVIPQQEGGARDRIVTPTLGEIYAAQGQYAKAIGVFELLSKKDPTNRHFREKIDYLKKRLQETQNAA